MTRSNLLFIDSETCGLHSIMVLLQYAQDDGEIVLYNVWREPVGKTLDLLEWIATQTVVGFNLVFDWFHVAKLYTIWRLLPRDWIPEQHIDEIALIEPQGQNGPCIKPVNACDLLLHSRKGPYQSLMARENIRIRRVPTALAYALAEELESRVELDGIYFARSADKDAPRWNVYDIKKRDGEIDQHFKDVVLRFSPAGGLKFLAEHALGYSPKFHFKDVEPDKSTYPKELGYAPIALAVSSLEKNWEVLDGEKLVGYAWPGVVQKHINHWADRADAREYARDDIVYTRALYKHFGSPEPGDDDSILACMVPVIRWRGFTLNLEGIKELLAKAEAVIATSPVNINKPNEVRRYIGECMDDTEKLILEESTKKAKLTAVSNMRVEVEIEDEEDDTGAEGLQGLEVTEHEPCTKCDGKGCARCEDRGYLVPGPHPASRRAAEILEVKSAAKEVELYRKLLTAGKFHASFVIVGTLSSRMSGGDGLNAQGIKHAKEVRQMFPLAWDGYVLSGGDFDSFEVTLADAVYNDEGIRQILISGQKIHAYFAMCMYPGTTYSQIMESEGSKFDMYTRGKSGIFGMIYGGDWTTLVKNFGIDKAVAQAAEAEFFRRFPGVPKARERVFDMFCSMRQPQGLGSAVIWQDPAECVESFLGFRRYFTLEKDICKTLFDLARKPPKNWKDCAVKVVRRDRVQTAGGAVASALYGAAFQIQAANMRAAANHEIQSPGAQITKALQRRIWDLQPAGVHDLKVAPMNIHDEIMCVNRPEMADAVVEVVRDTVESYRPKVPLIGMTWYKQMASWAGKKGGDVKGEVRVRSPLMS